MTMRETMLEVAAEAGDAQSLIDLLGLHFDETPTLRPSTDFQNGHLYITVPVQHDKTATVGKGKAAKEVTRQVWNSLAICDDGSFFLYDEDNVRDAGFRYPGTVTQPTVQRWHPRDMQEWMLAWNKDGPETVSPAELYDEIRGVYRDYVEYPEDIYYDLVPLYVMSSYVFRLFRATGYIHFNGTAASGKSQNLRVLSALALNPVWSSNLSPATLFRAVAGSPGVICVDEAESFDSEKGAELRQLLLSGYADGATAGRTEKGENDRFQTVYYETYSPKVIASINPLDPVLGSRCVVVPMAPAIRPIPEFDPSSERWAAIRNRCYRWALEHGQDLATLRNTWDLERRERIAPDIKSRAWEIAQAYLILAEHVGGMPLVERVVAFFNDYFARQAKSREEADRQYMLLKALPRVMAEKAPHPGGFYSIHDIHELVSGYLESDVREYYKTKSVSRHLTVLGFKERKTVKGGTLVRLDEAQVRTEFEKRHVTPFDEDIDWLAGTRSYADGVAVPAAPPDQLPPDLSWLEDLAEPNDN